MTSFENLTSAQKNRAALHRDVRAIATETCHFLGLEITKPAMEIVAELIYKKLTVYGTDLEAFAKHAKRTTINSEDVKLLVRRCPSLKNRLNVVAPSPKEKRKKSAAPKAPETPAPKQNETETPILKQKETEVPITKKKAPEIPTSKLTETETLSSQQKELEDSKQEKDKEKETEIDSMVIDDMIDLTFD